MFLSISLFFYLFVGLVLSLSLSLSLRNDLPSRSESVQYYVRCAAMRFRHNGLGQWNYHICDTFWRLGEALKFTKAAAGPSRGQRALCHNDFPFFVVLDSY